MVVFSIIKAYKVDFKAYFVVEIAYLIGYTQCMIETIFGNATAAKVMLYLFHYGEAYTTGIAQDMGMARSQVQKQLDRFEAGGVLVSKLMGKVRIYSFNPKLGVTKKIKELIQVFYDAMPLEEKEKLFNVRRRPRRKGKPVMTKVKNEN